MATEVPVPDVPRPDDFDCFWEDALSEARQYGLNPVVTEDPLRSNDRTIVYKVSFTSLERVRVGGWYAVPCGAGPFPALQMVPGYSMHANLSVRALAEQGIATLWLSIRGHDFDSQIIPGFPGFLCHNITDRHRYSYSFVSAGTNTRAVYTARALGDLDCDGKLSTFELRGSIDREFGVRVVGPIINNELE